MKVLAKNRLLTAAKAVDANVIYDLYKEDSGAEYDLMGDYKIEPNSLIEFAYENNVLELLAKYWLKEAHGFTGNFGYDLEWYHEENDTRDPVNFINWLIEDANYGNMRPAIRTLEKEYLNLAKTKYRKYVYPVMDTYYYQQAFSEFDDFDPEVHAEQYRKSGDYRDLEDYVKSTGFR